MGRQGCVSQVGGERFCSHLRGPAQEVDLFQSSVDRGNFKVFLIHQFGLGTSSQQEVTLCLLETSIERAGGMSLALWRGVLSSPVGLLSPWVRPGQCPPRAQGALPGGGSLSVLFASAEPPAFGVQGCREPLPAFPAHRGAGCVG